MPVLHRATPLVAAGVGGVVAAATLSCSPRRAAAPPPPAPAPAASPHPTPAAVMPAPEPQPAADGPCGYLSVAAVQSLNGQRVGAVRTSGTGPGQPYPACFFFARDGTLQLRTWILLASPQVARATVDAAAPVATSDLAQLPGGWSGGSQPTAQGAVFAVARQGTAVVITTNQHQTIAARRVAQLVIAALGL
jgi:UPF0176 protein